jgi:hypothetical protein
LEVNAAGSRSLLHLVVRVVVAAGDVGLVGGFDSVGNGFADRFVEN